MQIIFQGDHSSEEAAESLLSILKLFKDKYDIQNFREINLDLVLLDNQGHDVELVDASTAEVYGVFEVYKSSVLAEEAATNDEKPNLKLVVDNTKE